MQKNHDISLRKLHIKRETVRELNLGKLQFIRGGGGDPRSDVSNNCCDPDQTN